ncbi:P-loop containing nucleoside triphosphate hydrolase protein, partial [Hyaloraphidium curvatum]
MAYCHQDIVDLALSVGLSDLIGAEQLRDEFELPLRPYTTPGIPRGIVLWGPPGTGKTMLVERLCAALGVFLIVEPMSSADFDQGIVGDDKRMFNELADRAERLPWAVCVAAIDEIDTMAMDRSSSSGREGRATGLNSLLSLIAGIKDKTKNLVLFGSTNRFDVLDPAFLRRMHVKIFVGLPSAAHRQEWIHM